MIIRPNRRDFPASASLAAAGRGFRRPGASRAAEAAGNDDDPGCLHDQHLLGPAGRGRNVPARRVVPTSGTCARRAASARRKWSAAATATSAAVLPAPSSIIWMPARRSPRSAARTSAATSCSRAPIRNISDLMGRRVGIQTLSLSAHLYLSIMATHIGLDAQQDIQAVTSPEGDASERRSSPARPRRSSASCPSCRSCATAASTA